jgi:magnesium transporter
MIDPKESEVFWLRKNFKFLELHYEAVAEHQQRPHFDQGTGYDFMVLLFPVYHRENQEIIPGEVDFFVGENFLITVHYGEINTLKNLFDKVRTEAAARNCFMGQGSGYLLYKILEELFKRSYPILDHMSKDVNEIQTQIFHRGDIDLLSKISLMKRNVIEFRKMMKTHHYILEKLPKLKESYLHFPQSRVYYKDLLQYSSNIWDILEALKETADNLSDTSQSLATHRLNQLTRAISVFSAILLPATLVAFVFGISVESLPFKTHPYGFWIIIGLMFLSSLTTVFVFIKKKWF